VRAAHTYFNQTLASTVVDMDRKAAISFLNECYDTPYPVKMEKYLDVVGELRREVDG